MPQDTRHLALLGGLALALVAALGALEGAHGVITLQIGGATRLGSSLSRQRDRYSCYWDCDLVGCQIARDDDECAYDCEKICRVRYDYAGRSAGQPDASGSRGDATPAALDAKSAPVGGEQQDKLETVGKPVRLHLPRNVSARNFGFWERCAPATGANQDHNQDHNQDQDQAGAKESSFSI